jgi:hypothetical protein
LAVGRDCGVACSPRPLGQNPRPCVRRASLSCSSAMRRSNRMTIPRCVSSSCRSIRKSRGDAAHADTSARLSASDERGQTQGPAARESSWPHRSCGVQADHGKMSCLFNGEIPMIKSLVIAAALSIGLAGYAFAQNTITGAPAGTAPETPAPGTPLPIPGVTPTPTGSHSSQMRHRANTSRERARASAHHMHHMRHHPAPKPAT